MKSFTGEALRWESRDSIVELTLDREPANEIGSSMLAELEQFVATAKSHSAEISVSLLATADQGRPREPQFRDRRSGQAEWL